MKLRLIVPVLAALSLAACNNAPPPATPPRTAIGQAVEAAIGEARKEMTTENLTLESGRGIPVGGGDQPAAEIDPQGEFLIEGKPVKIDDAQRALLLKYRKGMHGIAETGMAIGIQGADLAGQAVKEAIGGLLEGKPEQIGQKIEAGAKKLEADAKRICAQLPALLATQDKLAAALPEFKPYARLTQADVDDCLKENGATARAPDMRTRVREGIR
ncbi:hypothetical protein EBB59_01100 [Lysobacter pythonis]|uniref:DUF2884 family protein n=1 Tax=Solilutibacter pythonis TaxID=2483112 RepID=A0A3M2I8W3_9GAMM|nr:hypothetical protein [Lysobacter pythonis]RMH94917.1 hypothetical protein EBB59_01100 [Lysobacter pythonis]